MKPALLLIALLLGNQAEAAPPCPPELRLGMVDFDVPPLLEGRKGESPKGQIRVWADRVLLEMGCPASWQRLPLRRLAADLESGEIHLALGFPVQAAWAHRIQFPQSRDGQADSRQMLAESRHTLFVLASRRHEVQWDGKHLSAPGLVVGFVSGSAQLDLLAGSNWKLDPAPSYASNLAKLRRGRVTVALLPALVPSAADLAMEPAVVALYPPVQVLPLYAPANPLWMEANKAFVKQFWAAMCRESRKQYTELPACPKA